MPRLILKLIFVEDQPDGILLGDDPQAVLTDETDLSLGIKLDLETNPRLRFNFEMGQDDWAGIEHTYKSRNNPWEVQY